MGSGLRCLGDTVQWISRRLAAVQGWGMSFGLWWALLREAHSGGSELQDEFASPNLGLAGST